MIVNVKIRELRLKNKMKQEELAEHLGVSRQTITKWESGVNLPDCENLVNICELFGVASDELLGLIVAGEKEAENCDSAKEIASSKDVESGGHCGIRDLTKWLIVLCAVMSAGAVILLLLLVKLIMGL